MWALAGGSGGVAYPSLSLYGHFKSDKLTRSTTSPPAATDSVTASSRRHAPTRRGGSPNTFGFGILDCAFLPNSATLSAGTRECDAATGYDGPSGVGTPVGLAAFTPMGPTAKLTVPGTVTHGVSASFSGSTSTDPFPGGKIKTYSFAWGDGTTTTGTSATATHTYATAGTKSLTADRDRHLRPHRHGDHLGHRPLTAPRRGAPAVRARGAPHLEPGRGSDETKHRHDKPTSPSRRTSAY